MGRTWTILSAGTLPEQLYDLDRLSLHRRSLYHQPVQPIHPIALTASIRQQQLRPLHACYARFLSSFPDVDRRNEKNLKVIRDRTMGRRETKGRADRGDRLSSPAMQVSMVSTDVAGRLVDEYDGWPYHSHHVRLVNDIAGRYTAPSDTHSSASCQVWSSSVLAAQTTIDVESLSLLFTPAKQGCVTASRSAKA